MNVLRTPFRLLGIALALGSCFLSTAGDNKPAPPKAATPAPRAPSAKPAGTPGAHPGAAASHGPTTASHGPTTAGATHGPTTAGATHGPTTAGASHGATTAGASHGATTESASRGATTAGASHGATTAGGARASTAGQAHERTAGESREGKSPGGTHTEAAGGEKARSGATPGHTQTAQRQPVKVGESGRPVAANHTIAHTKSGAEVQMRPGGHPANIHVAARGMDIHHNLAGGRRVEVVRADHSRVVVERGGRGYVQRPYMYGGREYGHRTYYYGGRAYDRYYYGYPYRGAYVNMYTPAYYYPSAFYGWAYNPWVAPVPYAWGWGGNPWVGYYGGYFSAYTVYPSASFWLTDYLLSTTLAAAYQARAADNAAQSQAMADGGAPLSPDVKNLISEEVGRQISIENAESQSAAKAAPPNPNMSGVQAMLTDGVPHVFVAGRSLDVVNAASTECAISEGDALQLLASGAPDAETKTLTVLSSKGGPECRVGDTVAVAVVDLQDMQNHMRETIDQGMGDLKAKQAKGGLPAIPSSANGAGAKAEFAANAPGPDPQAATEIAQQSQAADQAEKQTLTELQAPSGPGPSVAGEAVAQQTAIVPPPPAAPAPELKTGMSMEDLIATQGQPEKQVSVNGKKMLIYKDMNVTVSNGKVTDIKVK